jgi:hypothetical protein
MRWLGIAAMLLLAAFFGLLGLGNYVQVVEAREIWASGEQAEGTLVEHHGYSKSNRKEYSYSYRVGGAELRAERRSIPWEARNLPVGSKLVVKYARADPRKSVTAAEMEVSESAPNRWAMPVLAIAFLVFAAAIFRRGRKPAT